MNVRRHEMKFIKKYLLFQLLGVLMLVGLTSISQAAEMDVDVGIEFTEIDPEPKPKPDPDPIKEPKPPIKKVIQLPQTGEKKSQGFTLIGTVFLVSAAAYIYKRKSGVADE